MGRIGIYVQSVHWIYGRERQFVDSPVPCTIALVPWTKAPLKYLNDTFQQPMYMSWSAGRYLLTKDGGPVQCSCKDF